MKFADRCAGCHVTAVDAKSRAFSAVSLDCYACHGDVPLDHTKDTHLVLLSKKNRAARQVVSICGQCHLRGGKSKSTGLPYPNTFVAGDNLFRDFQVNLSGEAINALPAIEQHIFQSVRDVALFGRTDMSCTACHDVHQQSSDKHQQLDNAALCAACHVTSTDNTRLKDTVLRRNQPSSHYRICEY